MKVLTMRMKIRICRRRRIKPLLTIPGARRGATSMAGTESTRMNQAVRTTKTSLLRCRGSRRSGERSLSLLKSNKWLRVNQKMERIWREKKDRALMKLTLTAMLETIKS
jgi:hypothetical protein